ncbi:MAG: hypothetical protein D6824_09920, partial [Planctomycetota bacterium]
MTIGARCAASGPLASGEHTAMSMRILNRLRGSVAAKLALMTGVPLLAMLVIALLSLGESRSLTRVATEFTNITIPTIFSVESLKKAVDGAMLAVVEASGAPDSAQRTRLIEQARKGLQEGEKTARTLEALAPKLADAAFEGAQRLAQQAPEMVSRYRDFVDNIDPVYRKLAVNTVLDTDEAMTLFEESVKPAAAPLLTLFQSVADSKETLLAHASESLESSVHSMRRALTLGPVAALALSSAITIFFAVQLRRRLVHVAHALNAVRTDWDLSRRIGDANHDEIADIATACDELIATLESIITEVRSATADVAS